MYKWRVRGDHPKRVFLSVRAQHGNLGDFVIRRYVTDAVQAAGSQNHLLVKGVSKAFISGLDLSRDTFLYHSVRSWLLALIMSRLRGHRIALVYTPGPQSLKKGLLLSVSQVVNLGVSILVRVINGDVLKVGRSLSKGGALSRAVERMQVRVSSRYTVRDVESKEALSSSRVIVRPDAGFAARVPPIRPLEHVQRSLVALSFREDRRFDRSVLQELVRGLRSLNLVPVFISQVKRDDDYNSRLAAWLGTEHVRWPNSAGESAQLIRVFSLYGQSRAVISNRLHALIFGLRCGATPVGLSDPDDPKLAKSLGAVGLSRFVTSAPEELDIEAAVNWDPQMEMTSIVREAQDEYDLFTRLLG